MVVIKVSFELHNTVYEMWLVKDKMFNQNCETLQQKHWWVLFYKYLRISEQLNEQKADFCKSLA